MFDKAVKKYRKKELQESKKHPHPFMVKSGPTADGQHQHEPKRHASERTVKPTEEKLKESEEAAQCALEVLPHEIVRMSHAFKDYMRFFMSEGSGGTDPLEEHDAAHGDGQREDAECASAEGGEGRSARGNLKVPGEMRVLLDELARLGGISERVKAEILQDDDARKVRSSSCVLSVAADDCCYRRYSCSASNVGRPLNHLAVLS